jgi:nitric oxide reductase large subunit
MESIISSLCFLILLLSILIFTKRWINKNVRVKENRINEIRTSKDFFEFYFTFAYKLFKIVFLIGALILMYDILKLIIS